MPDAERLDLRGVLCPTNFVYIKLRLEEMAPGDTLEVTLDDGEPMRNVPRSLKAEGHRILQVHPEGEHYRLLIQRGAD
ncbi:MAG: sulfurtransferase TusA family protein [Chloroflexi bacterium]|nr:sulfurtransferase TusA family protein [Chloroflexota bacterium]